MWGAVVFYFVASIFVVVYSEPELCYIEEYGIKVALCRKHHVEYTFDFIPPISEDISLIDLSGQPLKQLPYNAFRNLSNQRNLSEISLRYCEISHVDAGALLNLHSLTTIELSYNDINHIDSKLFSDTKQMEYIFMGNNKIEVLPSGLFQNLTLLERVHLNDNRIRQVEKFSFKNTPALQIIDLSNNQIEVMDILFKDKIDNLSHLWLYDNPWKCNCELGPLYEFLIKIDDLNEQELVCDKPPTLHGRNWSDISRDEFVCPSDDATSTQDSLMTSTELLVTNDMILKLDNDQGINKDAEPVGIEEETLTTFEKPKTESSEKPITERKPETRTEISDITQRPLTNEGKQVVTVEEESNSSEISELVTAESDTGAEESIKTPHEPVDDQIVTTTTEISFYNHEGADTNVPQVFNDLKWLPWTLFSVAIVCILGCAARHTFTRYRIRIMPTVRMFQRTEQPTEETIDLMYFHTAQQANS